MKRRTTKFNYFDAFASQAELAAKEAELLMLVVENFDCAEKLQEYLPEAHRILPVQMQLANRNVLHLILFLQSSMVHIHSHSHL